MNRGRRITRGTLLEATVDTVALFADEDARRARELDEAIAKSVEARGEKDCADCGEPHHRASDVCQECGHKRERERNVERSRTRRELRR